MKKKVLFICTHNSVRSQMAEGLLNALHGERYEGYSGGIEPGNINLYAVKVMSEIGIDISGHHSKHADRVAWATCCPSLFRFQITVDPDSFDIRMYSIKL